MTMLTRREMLRTAGVGAAALVGFGNAPQVFAQQPAPPAGPHTLPKLPYENNALAPHIDERTMRIHHTLHHQAYINNLNTALQGQAELRRLSITDLVKNVAKAPENIRQALINNGGGHYNHSMFWEIMAPPRGGDAKNEPAGALAEAINTTFESFGAFQRLFKQGALGRFGSGWTWLVWSNNRLSIVSTANQDCPLMNGSYPVLGIDVWEHAYYLNYQNRRADYVDAWWNVVNWTAVGQRFQTARA